METPESFGSWLKSERKKRRLTQPVLGQRVSYSAAQIRKVEAGERAFGDAQARLLAEYLGVLPEEQDAFIAWARGGPKPDQLSALSPALQSSGRKDEHTALAPVRQQSKTTDTVDHVASNVREHNRKRVRRLHWPWIVGGILVSVLLLSAVLTAYLRGHAEASGRILPGGRWLSPSQNFLVRDDTLHFAALAYPSRGGDAAIAFVNFTVSWLTPTGDWRVACTATTPVVGTPDRYECDWNLASVNVPNGVVKVSFDVYDTKGNVNMAPNGIHEGTVQR